MYKKITVHILNDKPQIDGRPTRTSRKRGEGPGGSGVACGPVGGPVATNWGSWGGEGGEGGEGGSSLAWLN